MTTSPDTIRIVNRLPAPGRHSHREPMAPAFTVAKRNKTQFALTVVDPQIAAIERARVSRRLSHNQLTQAAGVHPSTWFYLRHGEQRPSKGTLERLRRAIEHAPPAAPIEPLAALMRATQALLIAAVAGDRALLEAINPKKFGRTDPTLQPRRIRTVAIYLLTVELAIDNHVLAKAIGCSRNNVRQVRADIEEIREEGGAVDALFLRVAELLRGEG